jgi:integrase/recombinase XerD
MVNELETQKVENFALAKIEEISEEDVWLENFTSKATKKTYKATVKKFCSMFEIKNIDQLRSVTSMHIIKFRDAMKSAGEKNSSINNRMAGLSSLFKHLIERQLIKSNPVYGVKTMKQNYRNVSSRALTGAEVEEILKQPDTSTLLGLRDKAILSILFNVGTRVGTIAALRIKDIQEEGGFMIFDMHLKGDKNNKVAVNPHIQSALRAYFEEMKYYGVDAQGKIKISADGDLPVFPRMSNNSKLYQTAKPMSTSAIRQLWHKYANGAGLERTRPHCGRATFITEAFNAGIDSRFIQETAGHSDPRTTMSYNHSKMQYKNSASFGVNFG